MNTSASTRSGRRSEIFLTAASPLPTATTSMPWSFRARLTIFWMLLLSSATKILATERSSGDTAAAPHATAQLYWSIRSKTRQRSLEACVAEGEYRWGSPSQRQHHLSEHSPNLSRRLPSRTTFSRSVDLVALFCYQSRRVTHFPKNRSVSPHTVWAHVF